jgi:hypothetical protein
VLICGLAAELLSTRRQSAALFHHANEGIVLVGPDGRIGAVNPVAGKANALRPRPWTDLMGRCGARSCTLSVRSSGV